MKYLRFTEASMNWTYFFETVNFKRSEKSLLRQLGRNWWFPFLLAGKNNWWQEWRFLFVCSRPAACESEQPWQVEEPLLVADWRHFVRVLQGQRPAGKRQSPADSSPLYCGRPRRDGAQILIQTHEEDTRHSLPQGQPIQLHNSPIYDECQTQSAKFKPG